MFWFFFSGTADQSVFKKNENADPYRYFFFNGCAKHSNVQAVIKMNFINVMTSNLVPPSFCALKPDECKEDNVEVFAGSSGITKYEQA